VTEQSKIPLPPEKAPKPKSLFERAEALFGQGGGLTAPPVPHGLVEPPAKRASRKGPSSVEAKPAPPREAPPAIAPVPAPTERAPEPQIAVTPAAVTPEPDPVTFDGPRHPIDRAHLRKQGLIQPEGKTTALLEEFRIVKRQLLLAARDARRSGGGARAQRVLVCSPLPGEGKTFCATNLAIAMAAEKDSEVLLVDADFAKPSILAALGLPAGRGLMDALADPAIRVEDCVLATDIDGLYVLPAGSQTSSDSEYLSSDRTADLLDRLTQGAPNRIVIFDSPPALAASPAADLAKHVGQALVVARADSTGQSALEDALTLLATCPDIKLLLNGAQFSPSGRRFGTYYGYGA
jgi:exopolysaccharide/PEP-CTERM locus tyrosine autokinase